MGFQDDPELIRWRVHFEAPISRVYQALSTDAGRASFWAESAVEEGGFIHFAFPNGITWDGQILQAIPGRTFSVHYYGGSIATFELREDPQGGTELTLTDSGVHAGDRVEVMAGWVSVLMCMKAAVDFGVDLRLHDRLKNWDSGYVEN